MTMGSSNNGSEPLKAVEQDDLVMPIIDFSNFTNGTPDQKLNTANQILHAFKTSGFLYLSNHPIPPSTISSAFSHSAKFFARPQAEKDGLAWTNPQSNRGYVSMGREKVSDLTSATDIAKLRTSTPDLKETMEIGRDNHPTNPNNWPTTDASGLEFTNFFRNFHTQLTHLHREVMRAIAVGLMGLPALTYFDSYTAVGDNNLRLLHYPSVPRSVFEDNPSQVRTGPHSDYGSITLLFQDDVGGLQVRSPKGTWVPATPVKDTIVVNAGDLLARWSNDVIVSTKHRVIQPPVEGDGDMYPERYSIAFFCVPDFERWIEAIPGTYGGELGKRKYEGVNSGDYLVQRLAATY